MTDQKRSRGNGSAEGEVCGNAGVIFVPVECDWLLMQQLVSQEQYAKSRGRKEIDGTEDCSTCAAEVDGYKAQSPFWGGRQDLII